MSRTYLPKIRSNIPLLKGFTLVELLMAVALSAFIMGIAVAVFSQAGTVVSQTSGKVEMHAEARFILEKMASEISRANNISGLTFANVPFKGIAPNGYFKNTNTAAAMAGDPPSETNYRQDAIGFVIDDSEKGQIQICYWLNIDDSSFSSGFNIDRSSSGLIRYSIPLWNSASSYAVGNKAIFSGIVYRCTLAHSNQQPPDATYWAVEPLDNDYTMLTSTHAEISANNDAVDTAIDQTTSEWRTLSENVISLEFLYYQDEDGDGRVDEDPDGDANGDGEPDDDFDGTPDDDNVDTPTNTWNSAANNGLPALVEIRLVVKDSNNRGSRLFTRMVHVPASLTN